MKYISTRGNAPELNFEDVIITGLAADGGLYVPETWPQLSPDQIRSFASMPYCDVAYEVMVPFVDGTIEEKVFKVSIIPTTKGETTLLDKHIGDELNIECDVVGKYIERFMIFNQEEASKSSIDINFLKENGFM